MNLLGGKYHLYNKPNAVAAEKAIDDLIAEFKVKFKEIMKKFPDVGIGDTVTDNDVANYIATELYSEIHSD